MEFVYVVKRGELFDSANPHGFKRFEGPDAREVHLNRIRERGFFVERRHAEGDSSFKQIIPYCVVVEEGKVLLLRRLKGQGEARLHHKLSIGVGGHINPQDQEGDILDLGTRRELHEEIELPGRYALRPIGIINDDTSEVGSVHYGIVYAVRMEPGHGGRVEIREKKLMEGSFVTPRDLSDHVKEGANFETWSTFLIDELEAILTESNSQPALSPSAQAGRSAAR